MAIAEKYLEAADRAIRAVNNAAPDIFDNVWSVLQDCDTYDSMRQDIALIIQEMVESK